MDNHISGDRIRLLTAVAISLFLVLALPLALAAASGTGIGETLVLAGSTLLVEYGSAGLGVAMGLSPLFILTILVLVALGVVNLLFALLDALSASSRRVSGLLERANRHLGSPWIRKYGVLFLVPGALTVGFYVCPAIAWVIGWRRRDAVLSIMTGYIAGALLFMIGTEGLFRFLGWH